MDKIRKEEEEEKKVNGLSLANQAVATVKSMEDLLCVINGLSALVEIKKREAKIFVRLSHKGFSSDEISLVSRYQKICETQALNAQMLVDCINMATGDLPEK